MASATTSLDTVLEMRMNGHWEEVSPETGRDLVWDALDAGPTYDEAVYCSFVRLTSCARQLQKEGLRRQLIAGSRALVDVFPNPSEDDERVLVRIVRNNGSTQGCEREYYHAPRETLDDIISYVTTLNGPWRTFTRAADIDLADADIQMPKHI